MKKYTILGAVLVGLFSVNAHAELYFEMGFEGGGDEIIGTTSGDSISAGGGVKLAVGFQGFINEDKTHSIRVAGGYLFDSVDAYNGEADIDAITLDAMYVMSFGQHSFGVGGTLHKSPEYSDDIAGYAPLKVEFDDAIGYVLEYGFHPYSEGLVIGARFTSLDYEAGGLTLDAGSFGLFISNGF